MNHDGKRRYLILAARGISLALIVTLGGALSRAEEAKKPAPEPQNDVLVLSNGDTLHGKLVKEVDGKVTFHTEALGDVETSWDKIKELHAAEKFGVLQKSVKLRGKK